MFRLRRRSNFRRRARYIRLGVSLQMIHHAPDVVRSAIKPQQCFQCAACNLRRHSAGSCLLQQCGAMGAAKLSDFLGDRLKRCRQFERGLGGLAGSHAFNGVHQLRRTLMQILPLHKHLNRSLFAQGCNQPSKMINGMNCGKMPREKSLIRTRGSHSLNKPLRFIQRT